MGGKDDNYKVVYRGESLLFTREGEWVFFQRPKHCGGGWWLGRAYSDCFWLEFERPTSLSVGILYLLSLDSVRRQSEDFEDDFKLT
ncbi:lF-82 [Pantoea sp. MBD-2R]|uniref:lF-82 n=1 Tax=Pantoea sp. MBD-2R TaxID=3141540 RepID=UPI0031838DE7